MLPPSELEDDFTGACSEEGYMSGVGDGHGSNLTVKLKQQYTGHLFSQYICKNISTHVCEAIKKYNLKITARAKEEKHIEKSLEHLKESGLAALLSNQGKFAHNPVDDFDAVVMHPARRQQGETSESVNSASDVRWFDSCSIL